MSEWDAIVRIGLALLVGAIMGLEREIHAKPAGIRTYALVCQGAAIFMVIGIMLADSTYTGSDSVDPSRLASTVVQGIGFLAAGVIFTAQARIKGLTTAAGIWVAAAVGLAIGGGYYVLGFGSALMTIVALSVFTFIERRYVPDSNATIE